MDKRYPNGIYRFTLTEKTNCMKKYEEKLKVKIGEIEDILRSIMKIK